MRKFIVACSLVIGLTSCQMLGDLFGEDTVFTTADQVQEGADAAVIPFDQLPESVKAKIPEGTSVVMTSKDALKAGASYLPAGGEMDEGAIQGIVDTVFGIGKTLVPSLAAWEGVVTLLSKRKRKHYVKAAKSLLPMDKNVDLGGTLKSVGAALGLAHSSETTKAAFEEEEEGEWEDA